MRVTSVTVSPLVLVVRVRVAFLSVSVGVRSSDGRLGRAVGPGSFDSVGVRSSRLGVGVGVSVVGMVVIVIVVVGSVRRTRNTISSIPSTSTDPSSLPSIRAYSEWPTNSPML